MSDQPSHTTSDSGHRDRTGTDATITQSHSALFGLQGEQKSGPADDNGDDNPSAPRQSMDESENLKAMAANAKSSIAKNPASSSTGLGSNIAPLIKSTGRTAEVGGPMKPSEAPYGSNEPEYAGRDIQSKGTNFFDKVRIDGFYDGINL